MNNLEDRILKLEAAEEIRAVKARYLACCDNKDPQGFRNCFADGKIHIDYGAVGSFDSADDLVAVYEKAACHPHMVEMHHGSNPRIQILDKDNARGQWSLQYQLINTREKTLTQIGGEYEDKYRRDESGWKISATVFTVISTLILDLDGDAIKTLIAARQIPAPDQSSDQKAE